MNKLTLLFMVGTVSLVMITLHQVGALQMCGVTEYGACTDSIHTLTMTLLPSMPLFLFSLLTYPLSEVIFQKWWYFVRISIPLIMMLTYLTPSQSRDWMFPFEQGSVAFFLIGLFSIGTIFIVYSTYRKIHE